MGTDSNQTNAQLKPMLDKARAAAQKPNPAFETPPERPSVTAQRNENDAEGEARRRQVWGK